MISSLFVTYLTDESQRHELRSLIESIRLFGGAFSKCPVWIFYPAKRFATNPFPGITNITAIPLQLNPATENFPFAFKVQSSAKAEELATSRYDSMIWLDPASLITKPPILFDMRQEYDLAIRPVHIRNVGIPFGQPMNEYWERIDDEIGIRRDASKRVKSFVDEQSLWPYFNCCAYALRLGRCILHSWEVLFEKLVQDKQFQSSACSDEQHRIFLHQAVFSTLVAGRLEWGKIRILPPQYFYPLHLHSELVAAGRSMTVNEVVGILMHGISPNPEYPFFESASKEFKQWLRTVAKD